MLLSVLLLSAKANALTDEEITAVLIPTIHAHLSRELEHPEGVCIYPEIDFRGSQRFCFTSSQSRLPTDWLGRVSSISVSSTYHATLFTAPSFQGDSMLVISNAGSLGDFNDLAVSIRVDMLDDDGDGVIYSEDECPDTRLGEGEVANSQGCATYQLDTDNDGVNDAIDQCPATQSGNYVDENGCPRPDNDADGDGTPNDQDAYPLQSDTQCPAV